jgi:hypothetical protein
MELMTKELEARFKAIGSQDGKGGEAIVVAKYFNPCGAGTWYALEYNPEEKLFFGYVRLLGDDCDEYGYFGLEELQSIRLPLGMGIERDLYCGEKKLKDFYISSLRND